MSDTSDSPELVEIDPLTADVDRRGFLSCMAWAGTGLLWTMSGGVPTSRTRSGAMRPGKGDLFFVQISDSHIGFNKAANTDVTATLQEAVDEDQRAAAAAGVPAAHRRHHPARQAGGVRHGATGAARSANEGRSFYVPGEHDVATDNGSSYLERYGKGTRQGGGWYSFDHSGVHFIGLVNVLEPQGGRTRLRSARSSSSG